MSDSLNNAETRSAVYSPAQAVTDLRGSLRERLARISRAVWMGEDQLFLLVAVIIGLFSGLVVVCFHICIDWVRVSVLGSSLQPSALRVLIAPTLGGLVVAYLVMRFFPRVRGSGVNQTKAAVYIYDGYIPFSTVIGKFICSALAIGSGQSLGPEDPALQIGAGMASALGRRLHLSRERVRLIAPIGAAAGLAAVLVPCWTCGGRIPTLRPAWGRTRCFRRAGRSSRRRTTHLSTYRGTGMRSGWIPSSWRRQRRLST